jgi:translation initiation factor IF-3
VRVVDDQGQQLGVIPTDQAKRMAREKNLDLVEVNPKAMPPVCKIMDFGKFKYEEKKRQREAKKRQSQVEIKEIKLRPKTDDHDVGFKIKHIRSFLEEGNKVKLTVRFRGREITHPETAQRQIDIILDAVKEMGYVEQPARMEQRTMTAMIAPRVKPAAGQPSAGRAAGDGGGGRGSSSSGPKGDGPAKADRGKRPEAGGGSGPEVEVRGARKRDDAGANAS